MNGDTLFRELNFPCKFASKQETTDKETEVSNAGESKTNCLLGRIKLEASVLSRATEGKVHRGRGGALGEGVRRGCWSSLSGTGVG